MRSPQLQQLQPAAPAATAPATTTAAPAAGTEAKPAGADEIVAIVNGVDIKRYPQHLNGYGQAF